MHNIFQLIPRGDGECGYLCRYTPLQYQDSLTCGRAVNGIAFVGIFLTYFPKRVRPMGLSKMDIVKSIDYIGAVLSITGLTLLLVLSLIPGNFLTHH